MSSAPHASAVQALLSTLESRMAELARRGERLASDNRQLRSRVDELQAELATAQARHRGELDTLRDGFATETTELRSRFEEELQCRRAVFESELQGQRAAAVAELESQRNRYDAELEDLRAQYLEVRTRLDLMVARLRAVEDRP